MVTMMRGVTVVAILAIAMSAPRSVNALVDCAGTAGTCLEDGHVYDTSITGLADSALKCDVTDNTVCSVVIGKTGYQECCVPATCANTNDGAQCLDGYVFSPTATPGTDSCDDIKCAAGGGKSACCVPTSCKALASDYCPYGYKANAGGEAFAANLHSVDKCCVEDTTVVNDFPMCKGGVGGSTAAQAQDSGDTNWAVQDGNGFTRTLGQYTGMCFSLTLANDCSSGNDVTKAKCCTKKPMSYLQFKLPKAATTPTDRKNALASLDKCRVSYGSDTASVRALKRVTSAAWKNLGDIQYANLPVTFKKGQKQATVCIYALNAAPGGLDCSWSNLCGIDAVTDAALGCEIRMVGKAPVSSACCSPTLSIDAFEASESRLASASAAGPQGGFSAVIELARAGL